MVKENVLPNLVKFPAVKKDFELRYAFWCFLKDYQDVCDVWTLYCIKWILYLFLITLKFGLRSSKLNTILFLI